MPQARKTLCFNCQLCANHCKCTDRKQVSASFKCVACVLTKIPKGFQTKDEFLKKWAK